MILLLDSHVLLWWLADDARLRDHARGLIADPDNVVFVSAATAWELEIKKALGRVRMPANLEEVVAEEGFVALPISIGHAIAAAKLRRHHDDPFDRMLVAQANAEGAQLVTADRAIRRYRVRTIVP